MLFRRRKKKIVLKKDSFQQTIASLSSKIGTLTDQRLNFHSAAESLNAARTPLPPFFFQAIEEGCGTTENSER